MKMLVMLLTLVIALFACSPHAATANKLVDTGTEYSVALVADDGSSYCAGVAVGTNTILTASHCVSEQDIITEEYQDPTGNVINVELFDGEVGTAIVTAWDPGKDLARLSWTHSMLTFAKVSQEWHVSEPVNIIGCPAHLKFAYMRGYISAMRRHESPINGATMDMVQVQAPVWYGNSGGGVFNDDGELLGIVSLRASIPDVGLFVAPNEVHSFLSKK